MDSNTLASYLDANRLLTKDDWERLQLPTMTSSDKAAFLYLKLLQLGKEEFETFMLLLKDANEHPGHKKLYNKLST